MPLAIPAELKKITPYVKRAEELDRDRENPESRLVAYYCRQYAVSTGIPVAKSAGSKQCLANILETLEEEKAPMSNFTRAEAKFLCRKFADSIFDKADGEDRIGLASKTTAKTFYAAATFYEILNQFYEDGGELSEEQQEERERTVYSKWKSTEILKALKEGRQPTPGGYGENQEDEEEREEEAKEEQQQEEEESEVEAGVQGEQDFPPPAPSIPLPVPPPVETVQEDEGDEEVSEQGTEVGLGPPPAYPGDDSAPPPGEVFIPGKDSAAASRPPIKPVEKPTPAKKSNGLFGMGKKKASAPVGKVSKEKIADAVELTKFALSALKSKDVEVGAKRLQEALTALGY
jgi:vacuolar protein sorting-associated protein VTA1